MSKVCPYCFDEFEINNTPFRCASHVSRCEHIPDEILKSVWNDLTARGKVLDSPNRFADSLVCPDCKQTTKKRLCPACHQELPSSFSEPNHHNYVFAVIGAKGTGKSHYIATFIHYIRKYIGFVLDGANDETINRYNQHFYKPVFKNHSLLPANQTGLADSLVRKPMIFSLEFPKKNWLGKIDNNSNTVFYISLFDTAGEDLNDQDTMSLINRYIYRADGILLLLDPLQLDTVRDLLVTKNSEVALPEQYTEAGNIINRVANLIKAGRNLRGDQKIPIPFAVALSKMDAVASIIDNRSVVLTPSKSGKVFDLKDFNAVDAEVQGYIMEWDAEYIINQVSTKFSQYGFFGLSALGSTPSESGDIQNVIPKRVADPFLWMLHKNKMIDATK